MHIGIALNAVRKEIENECKQLNFTMIKKTPDCENQLFLLKYFFLIKYIRYINIYIYNRIA